MAALWGRKIIAGTKTFADVPSGLKDAVKAYLVSVGRLDLIAE